MPHSDNIEIAAALDFSRRSLMRGIAAAALAATSSPQRAFAQPAAGDEALADLKQRLRNTRLPEGEILSNWSQGVPSEKLRALIEYWANVYDWRTIEAKLNTFPQFRTAIDGLNFHFLHVRSPHAN